MSRYRPPGPTYPPPPAGVGDGRDRDGARLGQDAPEEGEELGRRFDQEQACHRSLSAKQHCYGPPSAVCVLL
jgi:hypothetical protein